MGLIGRQEPTGAFAKLDDITSLFNGSATTFNLTLGGQDFFPVILLLFLYQLQE